MAAVIPAAARAATVAVQAADIALKVRQEGSRVSTELYGYDFIQLLMKILFFQIAAYAIAKYMDLVIGIASGWRTLLQILGFNTPNFFPQQFVDFYKNGYRGVRYWDIIKGLTVLLIILEYSNYRKTQINLGYTPSVMTEAVFWLIIGFFLAITVPELYQRVKEANQLFPPGGSIPPGEVI
mgnify:CR=1 FL=1